MCGPLLNTASHKAYRAVLSYQVSACGWIDEQHLATTVITIKLDSHMLDALQWNTIHFAFDVAAVDHVRA